MAQTGYTPISIYYSSTAGNTPTAGNLVAGELAINTADGKLFYKDSSGVVQTIATKSGASGVFTSVTDSGLTSGRVTYASTGGLLQDSANLTFDGNNLGIGTTSPSTSLVIADNATAANTKLTISRTALGTTATYSSTELGTTTNSPMDIITNGSTRMRIDSSGSVLIGTTSTLASEKFNVTSGTNAITGLISATNASQSNDIFRINAARNTTNGSYNALAYYNTGASAYKFVVTDGGNISTFGGQITFPATQSASSDANTLDDYEEGTFTPTLNFSGGTTGISYNTQVGRYTKIGNVVTVYIYIDVASKGSSAGSWALSNLPFTSLNSAGTNYTFATMVGGVNGIALPSSTYQFCAYLSHNTTVMNLYTSGNGLSVQQITNTQTGSAFDIRITGVYLTA